MSSGKPLDHVHPENWLEPGHEYDRAKLEKRHPEIAAVIAASRAEYARCVAAQAGRPARAGVPPMETEEEHVRASLQAAWPRLSRGITGAPNVVTVDHVRVLHAKTRGHLPAKAKG